MKKLITIITILAMTFSTQAGHHRVGEIIGAAVGGALIGGMIFNDPKPPQPVYVQQSFVPVTQPVVQTIIYIDNSSKNVVSNSTMVVEMPVTRTEEYYVKEHWADMQMPDGSIIKVWVPAHYEKKEVPLVR